ncbi:MAG: LEPR-XLL domain-containing protein, partial [Desulfobulbaceae bacterium]|nr:LEPR-XLL domain-containing protein [Desulfobulbaceae bacterium]
MARAKKNQNALLFEELEPRLLFSADALDALAAGAVEQDYAEEPAVIFDMEAKAEAGDVVVDQPVMEEVVIPPDSATVEKVAAAQEVGEQEASATSPSKELVFVNGNVSDY